VGDQGGGQQAPPINPPQNKGGEAGGSKSGNFYGGQRILRRNPKKKNRDARYDFKSKKKKGTGGRGRERALKVEKDVKQVEDGAKMGVYQAEARSEEIGRG